MNDATETLSIKALSFIAEREDLLDIFVHSTGLSLQELYEQADEEETWAAILDYILSTDDIVIDFCDLTKYSVQDLWRARNNLPGSPATTCITV